MCIINQSKFPLKIPTQELLQCISKRALRNTKILLAIEQTTIKISTQSIHDFYHKKHLEFIIKLSV